MPRQGKWADGPGAGPSLPFLLPSPRPGRRGRPGAPTCPARGRDRRHLRAGSRAPGAAAHCLLPGAVFFSAFARVGSGLGRRGLPLPGLGPPLSPSPFPRLPASLSPSASLWDPRLGLLDSSRLGESQPSSPLLWSPSYCSGVLSGSCPRSDQNPTLPQSASVKTWVTEGLRASASRTELWGLLVTLFDLQPGGDDLLL